MGWDVVKWLLSLYIPPKDNDPVHLFRYHMAQSVGMLGIWGLVWIAVFWLHGNLPPWVPNVAWADDLKQINYKIDAVDANNSEVQNKLDQLVMFSVQNSIGQAFKDVCQAQKAGNQQDLDNANSRLTTLYNQYYRLNGPHDALPTSCSTVLVDGAHH